MRIGLLLSLTGLAFGAGVPTPVDLATPQRLGGEKRFLTYVSTDKAIYREGETVFVRGVVLEAQSHTPAPHGYSTVTVKGPKGDVVAQGSSQNIDGAFGFSWQVPQGQGGGEYTITAQGMQGHAPGERKFDVRVYRPPRLKSQIVFARDGFGPGDVVVATLETTRAEGGVPTGAKVTAVARVDGVDVSSAPCTLDNKGRCTVKLQLPKNIDRGEGTVAFTIEDGGVVESATKTIPLLVQSFDVALFPEGGDLIAGLPGRVYVEARTLAKKPADLAGVVVSSKGVEVAKFRTEHEGRGRFTFTPAKGESYSLRITEPANVSKVVPLPKVAAEGATLTSMSDVASQQVKLTVGWTGDRVVKVTLRHKERELDSVTLDARNLRAAPVSLDPKGAEGVLIATVTTKDGQPLAERLVFRQPAKPLTIRIEPDRARYVPGAPVKLTVKTSIDGKPAPAFVGLTVTDDSVAELIDRREQAPSLPVMVFLEADVKELADAHVYLDPKHPKASLAVDLLLGTQGWRRFAVISVGDFLAREGDAARRALAQAEAPVYLEDDGRFEHAFGGVGRGGGGLGAIGGARPRRDLPPPPGMAPVPAAAPPPPRPAPRAPPVVARPAPAAPPVRAEAPAAKVVAADVARPRAQGMAKKERFEEKRLAVGEMDDVPMQFVNVREYAHQVRPDRKPDDRIDFAETLYWSAALKTDASGVATVSFGTSDAVTSFTVSAGGYTSGGALGSTRATLESVKPFYVEAKLPLEVTEGDTVRLPVAFVNGTKEPLQGVEVALKSGAADLRLKAPAAFGLKADERARRIVDLVIGPRAKRTELTFEARAGGYADIVTRELAIAPKGFPAELSAGGLLSANGTGTFALTMPADLVVGSASTSIAIYPSPAGNLSQALKSMIREPSGCFEQTSSTTYPMTMALNYFTSHTGADPAVVQDAQEKLERGYQRLVGYECKEKGYEWFGQDPGHEALTAYGILQFTDMTKVRQVDTGMLERSKAWLMAQRDGKGGFERKRRALHTWIEDRDTSDAYITWALLEAGEKGLEKEVANVKRAAAASKNSYVVALGANVAFAAGDARAAKSLLEQLSKLQGDSGFVGGGTQSIVGSTGQSLAIETTALATLGWLKAARAGQGNAFIGNVERAMKGLAEASKDGSYGATQSTVLALKAVLEYDRLRNAQRKPGSVRLFVDGKPLGGPQAYDGKTEGAITFPDASELLTPGAHTIELRQEGGGELPWSAAVRFNRVKPESSPEAKVAMGVTLPKAAMQEGDVVEATAVVTNTTESQLPTVVAIVGVPGGLEPRIDQLKELVKAKTVDAYEVRGRDVVLYWRGMTPKQQLRVPVSLVASVPGSYTGPASRAYLYYGHEHKVWVDGLRVDVAGK